MTRWTPASNELLCKMWLDGYGIKAICFEIGCSPSSLKKQRAKIGLPPRRPTGGARGRALAIYFSEDEYSALRRGAFRRHTSMSQYMRALVRRDASTPGGSVVVHHAGEQRAVI